MDRAGARSSSDSRERLGRSSVAVGRCRRCCRSTVLQQRTSRQSAIRYTPPSPVASTFPCGAPLTALRCCSNVGDGSNGRLCAVLPTRTPSRHDPVSGTRGARHTTPPQQHTHTHSLQHSRCKRGHSARVGERRATAQPRAHTCTPHCDSHVPVPSPVASLPAQQSPSPLSLPTPPPQHSSSAAAQPAATAAQQQQPWPRARISSTNSCVAQCTRVPGQSGAMTAFTLPA